MSQRVFSLRLLRICSLVSACLAGCASPPSAPQATHSSAQYTLAIFPWNMTAHLQGDSYTFGMAALKKTLARSAFVPRYSYYRFREATRITEAEVPGITGLWDGGHFDTGPPLDRVVQLGTKLAVDAVLVYAMNARPGPDAMWVHLFDIQNRKHYVADGWVSSYHADVVGELRRITRDVFAAFVSHREQATVQ